MKIALLGYGVEAESAYKYYKKLYPLAKFTAYDDKPEAKSKLPGNVKFSGNHHDFHDIDADIVIRTPAIAPLRISSSGTVTSVTKEFFGRCPAPIIGVTGTKGKGTTCSLVKEILVAAGKKVWLVGNIGAPALDVLNEVKPGDIVVYELSSFQLWDLEKSPHVAVVLMIEPDHLDVHENVEDYLTAKANITTYQKDQDVVVYKAGDRQAGTIAAASTGQKIPYPDKKTVRVWEGYFYWNEQQLCSTYNLKIIGQHNKDNACAAIAAVRPWVSDGAVIAKGLANFKGLPHRLEFVRQVNGIAYYNDSYSSSPASTKVAIQSFVKTIILIVGGYDRGIDYNELSEIINNAQKGTKKHIKKVLLIGQTKQKIAEKLLSGNYEFMDDLEEVVKRAQEIAAEADIILFSPACPSFDMFKNFSERGEKFKEIVGEL